MRYNGFVGPSYISQAYTADQEDLINLYTERMESEGATTDFALYPTPGVQELSSDGVGGGRAHFFMGGREFAVIGSTFYEVDANGAKTSRGTVAIDGNPATINSNGDGGGQIFVTSGGNGYVLDLTSLVFTQITALDGKATMGGHLDGYFLALDANTSTLYISDLLDGTTWDPTQFAQRSAAPDPWVAMRVSGQYIWLLGTQTSEVWYDAGTSPFPFAKAPSGLISYGIAGSFSSAILGKDLLWLSGSREGRASVLRASGFTPEVISTYPLQNAISQYSTIDDAQGDSYSDRGHNFYLLTFPTAGVTWCWDSETGHWHKRLTWRTEDSTYIEWRPRWHAFAHNQHRWLDAETPALYNSDVSFQYDVEDRPIRRVRRAPALQGELDRVFYAQFTLDLEPATATTTGQGSNPVAMMRYSDDGGKTWGTERWRGSGRVGQYFTRLEWFRLGAARRRVFEVAFTDPVPWRITNAFLRLSQPAVQGEQ